MGKAGAKLEVLTSHPEAGIIHVGARPQIGIDHACSRITCQANQHQYSGKDSRIRRRCAILRCICIGSPPNGFRRRARSGSAKGVRFTSRNPKQNRTKKDSLPVLSTFPSRIMVWFSRWKTTGRKWNRWSGSCWTFRSKRSGAGWSSAAWRPTSGAAPRNCCARGAIRKVSWIRPLCPLYLHEPDRRIGERLGCWRLSAVIGSGGMGTVYRAARDDRDFAQHAAVKVIAAGRVSRSSERRFREERQILARLEHPHVARLIDGGVTPDGSPYLVMEYVEGTPIDAWAEGVDLRERLRMFRQVCEAVQFAHQNLVVHCDLKSANILVTPEGTPKLLDFGIARFLERDGEETRTLLRPMTPDYASPEQVRGESPGTSSDIYSLGVLLL